MPKLQFTQEEINGYIKRFKESYHHFHEQTVKIAKAMAVHADGVYPEDLIQERRPNEPQEVMDYRKKIWTAKTKPTFSKVFSELQKIRRSSDWSIKYDLSRFTRITPEENIETYCEKNFPYFTSLTNWVFSLMLRKQLIDPNAIVLVAPIAWEVVETGFIVPMPVIYDSEDVIDYVPGDYVVLDNPTGSTFTVKGKSYAGKSFIIVTTQEIIRYDQVDNKGTYALVSQVNHGLPVLPAFQLKGILIDQADNHFLYESRIAGLIPELDEAVREYSDLQAAKVLHIYPERWEYTQNECNTCKGTSRRTNPAWWDGCDRSIPTHIECDNKNCHNGYIVAGPYSKIMVRPTNAMEGNAAIPTPPAGYVEKDVDIVRLQEEGVRKHIYDALAAINFEFLSDTPLNQSGTAKQVDMDALNNTVHSIAEDVVAAMDSIIKLIAYYRYNALYSFKDIDGMVPTIPVPEKYEINAQARTMEELTASKSNKTNPVIISALEIDYATKRFNNDHAVRDAVALSLKLDPLPNISEDDKMSRLSNRGILLESYVISSNMQEFIQRAIQEDELFANKTIIEQKAKLMEYAQAIIAASTTAAVIVEEEIDDESAE